MSESKDNESEKCQMWVHFITLIQIYGDKKESSQRKSDLVDFVATSVDDHDNFFYWLRQRDDVRETKEFPDVFLAILNSIISHRNVTLFKRFIYDFSDVYILYLSLTPYVLNYKSLPELLNILFLSYPIKRKFIRESLRENLITLFNTIIENKPTLTLHELLMFYQNFTFVYPDIQLDSTLLPETIRYDEFSDAEIGKRVQTYFLTPFSKHFFKGSPPIGVYQSDSDGTFLLKANYSKSQPISSTWYSLTNPLDSSIQSFLHNNNEKEGDVFVLKQKTDQVMFWICPHCSTQNNRPTACQTCHAPIPEQIKKAGLDPMCYVCPGIFMNNFYITQNEKMDYPGSYTCYSQQKANESISSIPTTVRLDTVFKLPPYYYLSCQFPQRIDFYNSIYTSLVLPPCDTGSIRILYSKILSVSYFAESSSLIISANPDYVASFKGISYRKTCKINKQAMTLETPIDKDLICNIHYAVLNAYKVVIQVYNNIIICQLREPISEMYSHLSQFMICNVPGDNTSQEKVGILGIIAYHYKEETKWAEIPKNAIRFSFVGNHFMSESGLRYVQEDRACRCYIQIGVSQAEYKLPWSSFIEQDNRIVGCRNTFLLNEFCYYSSLCCMDPQVDCMNDQQVLKFGYGPRLGHLYWKSIVSLFSFDFSLSLDMEMKKESCGIWWMTNATIPNHYYINIICKEILSSLSTHNENDSFVPIPFYLYYPMIFVIMKKVSTESMQVIYAFTTVNQQNYNGIYMKRSAVYPIQDHFSLQLSIVDNQLILLQNNQPLNYPSQTTLPSEFLQVNSYFLMGLSGSYMTLYDYSFGSNQETNPSFFIIPTTERYLNNLQEMIPTKPILCFPCSSQYHDKPAYGSTDPLLRNPKVYNGDGYVYALTNPLNKYIVITTNPSDHTICYALFDYVKPGNNMLSVYSVLQSIDKRLSRAHDSDVSCFSNNRIHRFGKNACGLENCNNTCFQNSTLQLLFHSDVLKNSIFHFYDQFRSSSCDQTTTDALCMKELVHLLTSLQVSIRAYEFNNLIEVVEKRFEIGYQHDMTEFFDFLLNSIDNCYNQMKKQLSEEEMKQIENPFQLIQGKQKEMICCQCGKSTIPMKEEKKETEFQNSYISLTSSIVPITSISFAVFDYDNIPSTEYTTYIYIEEYKSKGIFMVMERNPSKQPIANLILSDEKKCSKSDSVRIPSFHSYFAPYLFYQPFSTSFTYSTEHFEDNTIEINTTNQLVVDVLIRSTNGNSCPISQTNNGRFEMIGEFTVEETNYEIYQKIIDYSSAVEQKIPISLNPQFDLKSTVPTKIDTVLNCLSSVLNPSNLKVDLPTKPIHSSYILFSQDIQLGNNNDNTNQVNCLSIADKDNQMKIALYSKHALSGFASILPQQEKGFICRLELRIGNTLLHGECFYTNTELYLFEEASLTLYQFKISMDDYLGSIDYEGQSFICADYTDESNDDNSSVRHYLLVSENDEMEVVMSLNNEEGFKTPIHYIHTSVSQTKEFDGILFSSFNFYYLAIPHNDSFGGCYYSLQQDDETLPLALIGTSSWYQKKRFIQNEAIGYIYAGYSIPYYVYLPEVTELSISSMIQSSLNIQDSQEQQGKCETCHSPICKRQFITHFPEYLPISISRTFFDTKSYALTKDCSHIMINPSITILNEIYDLYAIVVHVGYSFDSGHYVVYCRHSDDEKNQSPENYMNMWNLFNDEVVYPCEWKEVLAQISDYGTCPYFVVYRRRKSPNTSKSALYVPSYTKYTPSINDYNSDLVELIEAKNDDLLSEVDSATFLLRKVHEKYENIQ